MHALHSLAHRAPPATRTRVRWQPYTSIPLSSHSSILARSPQPSYLITPTSSVTSPITTPSSELDRIRPSSISQTPKDFRDPLRSKYIIGLVDQAVKSLCDIWRPQDIPSAFSFPSYAMVPLGAPIETSVIAEQKPTHRNPNRNKQLPSPLSPSTRPSPPSPSAPIPYPAPSIPPDQDLLNNLDSRDNVLPIKGFVHEVLRRSRTSGCVLQTALCYLEAIRNKVPDIARQEKEGRGVQHEDVSERITAGTATDLDLEAGSDPDLDSIIKTDICQDEDAMDTVRIHDDNGAEGNTDTCLPKDIEKPPLSGSKNPCSLPSPLLCPRRAFLASLILASKFTQDKCYSNRAWAKLSGLPPREIGRCERALGQALDWRLWVGKLPVPNQAASPPAKRPVVRCQSEGSLRSLTTSRSPFLVQNEKSTPLAGHPSPSRSTGRGGLKRCATLPAEAFVAQIAPCDQVSGGSTIDNISSGPEDEMLSPDQIVPSAVMPLVSAATFTNSRLTEKIKTLSSPSPPTPGLTYSPSSSESSSGDRTIQMSMFPDDSMTPVNNSRCITGSDTFSWLENPDGMESPPMVYLKGIMNNTNPAVDHPISVAFNTSSVGGDLPFKLPSSLDFDPLSHPPDFTKVSLQ